MRKSLFSLTLSLLLTLTLIIPRVSYAKDYGSVDGIINDLYQVAYDSGELGSAQTSITISGLNGDTDKEYMLLCRVVTSSADSLPEIFFNNDSSSNKGEQRIVGNDATITANRRATDGVTLSYNAYTGSYVCFAEIHIYAKSGYVRTCIVKACSGISGTTVSEVFLNGGSWNDTSNNLTSLVLSGYSNNLGVGSRIILLKKIDATSGKKFGDMNIKGKVKNAWQEVYRTTLVGAQSSVTISGLNGNTDVIYRLVCRHLGGNASDTRVNLRYNGDSTSANYGRQWLYGSSTTAAAARNTASIPTIVYAAQNNLSLGEFIIYAKSGYARTMIGDFAYSITGTTVTGIQIEGSSWNNTTDNITSFVIPADQTNGLGIDTEIVLERLNLN